MRPLLLALATTAAGLAALLSFKTHSAAANAPAAGTAGGGASASASTGTGNAGTASGGSAAGQASSAPRGSSASSAASQGSTAGSAGTRTVTGTVASTSYGPMQVQVTLLGRKITAVKVLQQTDTGTMSQQIDSNAIPQLTSETLAAQSARINAVSGASYTSAGYIKSLQSALDKATA